MLLLLFGASLRYRTNCDDEVISAVLKNACIQHIDLFFVANLLRDIEVLLGAVAREVASDTAVLREVQLRERLVDSVEFDLNLWPDLLEDLTIEGVRLFVERIGHEYGLKCLW